MAATEYLILVNQDNQEIGQAEKQFAHVENLLHRGFSIFLLREDYSQMLLQQRAFSKYHSAGLWTNACCSHPRPGESILAAGRRRLQEELGIESELKDLGWFHYNAHFANGLSENEIDHVLLGTLPYHVDVKINDTEVAAYRWIPIQELQNELSLSPHHFTAWFQQAFLKLQQEIF